MNGARHNVSKGQKWTLAWLSQGAKGLGQLATEQHGGLWIELRTQSKLKREITQNQPIQLQVEALGALRSRGYCPAQSPVFSLISANDGLSAINPFKHNQPFPLKAQFRAYIFSRQP